MAYMIYTSDASFKYFLCPPRPKRAPEPLLLLTFHHLGRNKGAILSASQYSRRLSKDRQASMALPREPRLLVGLCRST